MPAKQPKNTPTNRTGSDHSGLRAKEKAGNNFSIFSKNIQGPQGFRVVWNEIKGLTGKSLGYKYDFKWDGETLPDDKTGAVAKLAEIMGLDIKDSTVDTAINKLYDAYLALKGQIDGKTFEYPLDITSNNTLFATFHNKIRAVNRLRADKNESGKINAEGITNHYMQIEGSKHYRTRISKFFEARCKANDDILAIQEAPKEDLHCNYNLYVNIFKEEAKKAGYNADQMSINKHTSVVLVRNGLEVIDKSIGSRMNLKFQELTQVHPLAPYETELQFGQHILRPTASLVEGRILVVSVHETMRTWGVTSYSEEKGYHFEIKPHIVARTIELLKSIMTTLKAMGGNNYDVVLTGDLNIPVELIGQLERELGCVVRSARPRADNSMTTFDMMLFDTDKFDFDPTVRDKIAADGLGKGHQRDAAGGAAAVGSGAPAVATGWGALAGGAAAAGSSASAPWLAPASVGTPAVATGWGALAGGAAAGSSASTPRDVTADVSPVTDVHPLGLRGSATNYIEAETKCDDSASLASSAPIQDPRAIPSLSTAPDIKAIPLSTPKAAQPSPLAAGTATIPAANTSMPAPALPALTPAASKTKSSLDFRDSSLLFLLVVLGLLGVVVAAVCNPLILPALSASLGLGAVPVSFYLEIYLEFIPIILALCSFISLSIKPGNNAIQNPDGFVHMIASPSSSAASAKAHSAPAPVIRMAPRAADVVDHKTHDDDQSRAVVAGARPSR